MNSPIRPIRIGLQQAALELEELEVYEGASGKYTARGVIDVPDPLRIKIENLVRDLNRKD